MVKLRFLFLLLLSSNLYSFDYSIDLPSLGKSIVAWAQRKDISLLEKCNQGIQIYGHLAGKGFNYLGQKLMDRNTPVKQVSDKFGSLMQRHGNYLQGNPPSWLLVIHAYISFRILQETLRYGQRMGNIALLKKAPDEEPTSHIQP